MDARSWLTHRVLGVGHRAYRPWWLRFRLLTAMALLVLAVMVPPAAAADAPITASMLVNGQPAAGPLGALQRGGTWYFEAGRLLQALGMRVTHPAGGPEVTATGAGMRLGVTAGSTTAYLDGAAIRLDTAPLEQGGSVYVPMSLIGLLGAQATWHVGDAALTVDEPTLEPTADIAAAAGGVRLFTAGGGSSGVAPGQALAPGDSLVTAGDGSAQIRLSDGSLIDVAPNSNLQLASLDPGAAAGSRLASFRLLVGRILARIFDLGGGLSKLKIRTPTAVIADRGTTFLIDVAPSGATSAAVLSGQITLAGMGGLGTPVRIAADQESTVANPSAPATPAAAVSGVAVDAWLARAVADAGVARVAEALAPQRGTPSQQKLLETALPTIQQTLNQLAGQAYVGHVTTTGGAGADLSGQALAVGASHGGGNDGGSGGILGGQASHGGTPGSVGRGSNGNGNNGNGNANGNTAGSQGSTGANGNAAPTGTGSQSNAGGNANGNAAGSQGSTGANGNAAPTGTGGQSNAGGNAGGNGNTAGRQGSTGANSNGATTGTGGQRNAGGGTTGHGKSAVTPSGQAAATLS